VSQTPSPSVSSGESSGQGSALSQTPSPSVSSGLSAGQGSQGSPTPSPSPSSWVGFAVATQLSALSPTPSPSESGSHTLGSPLHTQPASTRQSASQPSPGDRSPSSQPSSAARDPSPQSLVQMEPVPDVQTYSTAAWLRL